MRERIGVEYSDAADQALAEKLHASEKKKILEDLLVGPGLSAENLLKEGYVIIEELRYYITGEIINYSIGVEYKNKLFEGSLGGNQESVLEKLLSHAHLDIRGGALNNLALRLSKTRSGKTGWLNLIEVENNGIAF